MKIQAKNITPDQKIVSMGVAYEIVKREDREDGIYFYTSLPGLSNEGKYFYFYPNSKVEVVE